MRQRHKLLWAATLVCNVLLQHTASAGPLFVPQFLSGGTGRNIRHLPCVSRRTGETGVCMFAFTCAKANGTHLGTCIDRFYFGSCCKIDDEPEVFPQDNTIDVDNPLSMSKPFFPSTTQQALDSNDIPGNVDRPRPSSAKPTTGATLITRADPTTTQRTANQTKPKPYKIVTKKPVTIEVTTESFRISTFQTVQNASEPRPSTYPTIGTTKRPHNPTTTPSPSSAASTRPRPTSPISSVSSSFATVPPTLSFSTESASSIRPSSHHWSSTSSSSSIRPSSTHWSSTSSNFPHRNVTSKRPSPASTTVVTIKPTFTSVKPAESITKSPPSTSYVVSTTPKIQAADTSKPSSTVHTSTQKLPTVTRFPPRNATTKTPLEFGTKLSSPSSTTYVTTTTPSPTTIKDIEEKPHTSRKPPTKKPTRTTTKRPFTPTKKPTSSAFTRRPPSPSTATTSTAKPLANSTTSVTKTPTTQNSPSTGKRPSTTWPTKRPLNTTTTTTTTAAVSTTSTKTTTTTTTTTTPKTTTTTTTITIPTTTTIITKKPLTSTTKIPTTVRRPTSPTSTTRRNVTNSVTNQPTPVTSTTGPTKNTQKLSTPSAPAITTTRPKITDATTNKSTTSKIADTTTLRPVTEKPIKHSSTASVTLAATPSPDVTTSRPTTIYSTTKRTTSSSSTLLPVQNTRPISQSQTDSSFLASQQNVTSKPWSTSSLTTVSNEVDTEFDIGLSNQTESPPGIVTWTSLADDVETTRAPTTTADVTETDWTPITTPDGWIFIPSATTEKSEEENDLETKPVPVTTEIPFVSAKPVTESTTTRRTTTPPTTISSSSSSTTHRTTTQSTTYVDKLSTVATVTVSSEFTESPPTTPSAPLNMSSFKEVCGRRLFPEPKIVGGSPSTFGKWPWQISLRQWRTSTYLHKCGAALLNENWAITAAHCVQNVLPSDLLLRIGEYDLGSEEEPYGFQERRVQIVASHPNFDPRTFEFDLALMRFYEPVLPFQPNILPICVPDDDEDYVGQQAFVTGWGRLYEDGPLPSVLQEVAVPVINNTVCEGMYRNAGYVEHIPHIFICAGWRKGGFDSCEGDSGGPLVIRRKRDSRWVLAGVISWGIGCAEPNQPGVYTRISEFREWINQILQF